MLRFSWSQKKAMHICDGQLLLQNKVTLSALETIKCTRQKIRAKPDLNPTENIFHVVKRQLQT